jgi:hypothetical protein
VPALPGITGPGATPAPTPAPEAPADSGAPVFTTTPASLSGDTLTIEGLHGIAIVTVPLADGSTRRALRIEADRVVVGGFQLDVPSGEGGLRNTATTLTVDGHVEIYTPSITGIVAGQGERVIDTLSTPAPESLSSLLTVTLPLLGLLADSIVYDDSHQATM